MAGFGLPVSLDGSVGGGQASYPRLQRAPLILEPSFTSVRRKSYIQPFQEEGGRQHERKQAHTSWRAGNHRSPPLVREAASCDPQTGTLPGWA